MEIKTAVVQRQGALLEWTQAQLDEPKINEVLVKVVASGICHTDAEGRDTGITPYPVALGHEGAGIVEKVGAAVTTVKPGDHVVLSYTVDGTCPQCRTAHPGSCESFNLYNFGGASKDGTHRIHDEAGHDISNFFGQSSLSTYAVVDESGVVKVDPEVDLRYLGPLGCGFLTGAGTMLNYIKPQFGDTVAIFGAGAVGIAAIMGAKIMGCRHIIAVNRKDYRLTIAKEMGATEVINNSKVDPVAAINEIVPGGVDYVIDTTGVGSVILDGLHALRPGGECVLVGIGGDLNLNVMNDLLATSKKLTGVVEGDAVPQTFIPKLVDYFKQGKFPLDKLSRFYQPKDINQAFADSASGEVIKPIIVFDE